MAKTIIAWDTETALIRPGRTAPPLVCVTSQEAQAYEHPDQGRRWMILPSGCAEHSDADISHVSDVLTLSKLSRWLKDESTILVGHNVAFDMGVICSQWPQLLPLVFAAYDADRVTDTMLRQKLLDIAEGCYRGRLGVDDKWIKYDYSLQFCARRVAGMPIKKEGFRLFYVFFRNVPIEQWDAHAPSVQARAANILNGASDPEFAALAQGVTEKDLRDLVSADPREARTYPLDDARATMAVYQSQDDYAEPFLRDQYRQARRAFWLHLASAWGLRTNGAGVARLQLETERIVSEIEKRLVDAGLVRANGSRDTTAAKDRILAVCKEKGIPIRVTPAGEPSLDSDACKAADDPLLKDYADLTSLKAVLAKDVPALARATVYPIHTRFDLAETGRSTSSSPNVQNWRRLPGIRECFVPRPGRVFAQADYSGLELATLAQACLDILKKSTLADALNAGLDAHTALASEILRITYEEGERRRKLSKDSTVQRGLEFRRDHLREPTPADIGATAEEFQRYLHFVEFDNARQTAKVANFGFPGGLGPKKLVLFARKTYGVELGANEEEAIANARKLRAQWLERWPEMEDYFAFIQSLIHGKVGGISVLDLIQLRSERRRGNASYTAGCNSFFQGLGADATGAAGWLVSKACYVDKASPLYNSRIVNYVHDELIVETHDGPAAHDAAEELSRIMVAGAQTWIPDVKLAAEPCLMRVWSKDAKTLRGEDKRLIPWAPEVSKAA